ncbi:20585_t:CDS:2 [Dentiscutata erythropus]|uniref:20585_t:CDS:1 n=1 Tax=Dentiscutata erythropus TaxID=1348616 RepID=A0A9N9G2Q7_9GLOM|nr:20585_t:CDS:2 [Dentiscutata erythropus]
MSSDVTGEQYIRTLAQYIRSNARKIFTPNSSLPSSQVLVGHRRSNSDGSNFSMANVWSFTTALTTSYLKPASLTSSTAPSSPEFKTSQKAILLTLDPQHLYYLLTKFSDLGLDVGAFEVTADFKYSDDDIIDIDLKDETASITSANSVSSISSAMSSLSLFSGWTGWAAAAQKNENIPIKEEILYIYRAFTKLSGLKLSIVTQKKIGGSSDLPIGTLLSMTLFKCLTHLEIYGLCPKLFDGWDILQEKLEYLSMQKCTIDDISEVFIDAVVDGLKRRNRKDVKTDNNEDIKNESDQTATKSENLGDNSPDNILPPRIWRQLRQLNLSDNSLTFVASEPFSYITKCACLDLSDNLLLAVPPGLSQLPDLQYLNLSNNMIETINNIHQVLSNVTKLDLRNNRIENLCGLERLWSLEYVDVRENRLTDWAEIGRMSELHGMKQIFMEGNPFTKYQQSYRVNIFSLFREKDKEIMLDGTGPSYNERRHITVSNKPSSEKIPEAIPTSSGHETILSTSPVDVSSILKAPKSKHRRVVNLDEDEENHSGTDTGSDVMSIRSSKSGKKKKKNRPKLEKMTSRHRLVEIEKAVAAENDPQIKKKKSIKFRQNTTDSQQKSDTVLFASPSSESEIITFGEDYRRKIEELRNESGSSWLKVYNEMEYSKDENDRLREPPKMKQF